VEYVAGRLAKKFKTEQNFWKQQCETLEKHFNTFHNFEFGIKTYVVENLIDELQRRIPNEEIDHSLINEYAILRTFLRIQFLNKKIKEIGKTDFKKLLNEKKKKTNFRAPMNSPMMLVIENSGRIKLTNNGGQANDTTNELSVPILRREVTTDDRIEPKRRKLISIE
jgi:hypothetical protein